MASPTIQTLYGNQGVTTQSTIPAIPNYAAAQQPELPNMTPNFEAALQARAQIEASRERDAQRMRDLQYKAMQQQMDQARIDRSRSHTSSQDRHGFDPVDFEQQRAAIAQARAMSGGAPMRGVTGFNQIGSAGGQDVLDPSAMTGAQRRAFLPNSSQGGEFGPGAGGGAPYDPWRDTRSRNQDFRGADWSGMGRG